MKTEIQNHKVMRSLTITVAVICSSILFEGCASAPPEPDVPPPVAKSGPSFEETRDWIIATMKQYGGTLGNGNIWHTYTDVAISNSGRLTYNDNQYQLDWHNGSVPFEVFHVTIPLGAVTTVLYDGMPNQGNRSIQPNTDIEIETGGVAFITRHEETGNLPENYSRGSYGDWTLEVGNQPQAVTGQPLPISPQEMVKHFGTALQHMADICEDTYQTPTRTAQPF